MAQTQTEPKNALKQQPVEASKIDPKSETAASEPTRFDHPDAHQVFILTPYDGFENAWVNEQIRDELDMFETPPSVVKELAASVLYPGVVVYVAHRAVSRERDAVTKKFGLVRRLHVSKPIELKAYFGISKRNGGLDMQALQARITSELVRDPKGVFLVLRASADGTIKLFDN
jgi:hypothetical protein